MILLNNKIKPKSKVLPEILLDNRLEKDFQKMLYPVNLALSLFLLSKYSIKDDYIIPKEKKFYMLSFVCVACVYGLWINRVFFGALEDTMGTNNYDIVVISFAFFMVFCCAGCTILFVLNIKHSDIHISIILLIQRIYKELDFSEDLKKVTRWNWISMLSTVTVNIFFHFLYSGIYDEFYINDIFVNCMYISFDVHLAYGILVIILLRKYLEKWIADVLIAIDGKEKVAVDFFGVYRNILEAYKLYKNIFQLMILFHAIDTFFRSLCYFSILLHILTVSAGHNDEEEMQFSLVIFLAAIWLAKDIFLVIIQCVHCEKFYITVEEAETACIQRLKNKNYLDYEESLCSHVIQINRASFSKMSACGLFYIDASMPIQLIGILTNYIIVLLQSTFL